MFLDTLKAKQAHIFSLLCIANLIILVCVYIAANFFFETSWLALVISRLPHLLGIATLPLLFWSITRRNRPLIAINVMTTAFWIFVPIGLNVPVQASKGSRGQAMRVMTFNVRQAQFGHRRIAEVIMEHNPDVICVQEVEAGYKYGDPYPRLKKNLKGRWHSARVGDVATFSRYPIVCQKTVLLPLNTQRYILVTTIDVSGNKVSVLNTHLNVGSVDWLRERAGKSVVDDLDHMALVLSKQMEVLECEARMSPGHTVITGDLNLTPIGRSYRRIASKYQDAFRTSGWGFGYSTTPRRPLFRIDYIFADKGMRVNKCYVPSTVASDHRAVVADLEVPL